MTVKGDAAGGGAVAFEEPEVLDEPLEPKPLELKPLVIPRELPPKSNAGVPPEPEPEDPPRMEKAVITELEESAR